MGALQTQIYRSKYFLPIHKGTRASFVDLTQVAADSDSDESRNAEDGDLYNVRIEENLFDSKEFDEEDVKIESDDTENDDGDEIFYDRIRSQESYDQRRRRRRWPSFRSRRKCTKDTKLRAMYGFFEFKTPLTEEPMTSFEVDVEWNELKYNPNDDKQRGGVYVAYTTGMRNGPGGYFGVQAKKDEG